MSKVKILYDGRWIKHDHPDGITRYTRGIVNALLEKELDVDLVVIEPRQAEGLNVEQIIEGPSPRKLFRSRDHLARLSQGYTAYISPHYLHLRPKAYTPKFILTCHDLIPWHNKSATTSLAWSLFHSTYSGLKYLLGQADAVCTVSEVTRSELQSLLPKKPIYVTYNGVDLPVVDPSAKRKRQILYMGRYEPYKNVELMMAAANKLTDYAIVCAGSLSPDRQEELENILSGSKNVRFVGPITDIEYVRYLRSVAVVAQPSFEEGFGLTVIEAMSQGVAVVCSDIPVFHEIAGQAALFFDPHNVDDFAEKIRHTEDTKTYNGLVEAGRLRARSFSWERAAQNILRILGEI